MSRGATGPRLRFRDPPVFRRGSCESLPPWLSPELRGGEAGRRGTGAAGAGGDSIGGARWVGSRGWTLGSWVQKVLESAILSFQEEKFILNLGDRSFG